jgi:hypothetical protein
MRGWVCNLLVQLLLGLARTVTLGSKSRRTHGHVLLSHLRLLQPGGPGPRIYIPQEQGGPVILPGNGFPFCCLLRLAGLRWIYSNPPPHGAIRSISKQRLDKHVPISTSTPATIEELSGTSFSMRSISYQ